MLFLYIEFELFTIMETFNSRRKYTDELLQASKSQNFFKYSLSKHHVTLCFCSSTSTT